MTEFGSDRDEDKMKAKMENIHNVIRRVHGYLVILSLSHKFIVIYSKFVSPSSHSHLAVMFAYE